MNCQYLEHSAANAMGSITIPGFQPFIDATDLKNLTWILSTALSQRQDSAQENYVMDQSFYLSIFNPTKDYPEPLLSPEELPYTGCAILLKGLKHQTSVGPNANATHSCDDIFDAACSDAILSTINIKLLQGLQSKGNICQSIISKPPTQCASTFWSTVTSTQPFGNPSYSASINESCPSSVFNGTANLITTMSHITSSLTDLSTYDTWLKQATPLILVAFAKNETVATQRWGNSAMVCLTQDDVALKSRKPSSGSQLQCNLTMFIAVLGALMMFAGACPL